MSSASREQSFLAKLVTRLRGAGVTKPKSFSRERSSKRFPIQLPLKVKYGPAMSMEADGETRDVSVGGIFFVTPDAIPTGADIELLVPVPPPLATEGKMWMFCTARVVRTHKAAGGDCGVGAVISGYKVAAEA
ncbi:MAG: PilZ domain-containing protein [Acidobacteriales bacterium]|nr:PilZ domain-containing protein [Terriglobales bacterium]